MANEVSSQKIYRVGEVVADGESDQVVVTTLADLFDIKRAVSQGNSAQLVGSMTEEALHHLTERRYSSRFGLHAPPSAPLSSTKQTKTGRPVFAPETSHDEQPADMKGMYGRPSSNERRKRLVRDGLE